MSPFRQTVHFPACCGAAALSIRARTPVPKPALQIETALNDRLTTDEFDDLPQAGQKEKLGRVSACVARNTKRLVGVKNMTYGEDGQLALTEKG